MTGRQRVLTALRHREADRIPIDLGGTESSGMHADAYARLCSHLGVDDTPRVFDVSQQVTLISDDLRDRLGIDTTPMAFEPAGWSEDATGTGTLILTPENWRPQTAADGSRVIKNPEGVVVASMPPGGYYFDTLVHPLADMTAPSELSGKRHLFEAMDMPAFLDEGWEAMAARAKALHENSDRCVVANLCVHILAAGEALRGFENFMMDLVADRAMAFAIMEALLEAYAPRIDRFAGMVSPHVDVILVNDDLGGQGGPLLGPELYRDTVKKFHARLFEYIKQQTGKPLLLHSCGSVRALIPDLIEIGVDAINPVQVSAAEMDTAELKRDFGPDITFWGGGCDTQRILGSATPAKVADEVRRRIDDLAPGGGFVFTQVHNIQPDVPVENVIAMLETAAEYGAY